MRVSMVCLTLCAWLVCACDAPRKQAPVVEAPTQPPTAAAAISGSKPVVVAGALPVSPFVAEQRALADAAKQQTLVYVGASWCEPCQRFHKALLAGELDASLQGVRFIEYDFDAAKDALDKDGYRSQLIPLFVVPSPDGRASGRMLQGSIKGPGAVDNIVPRLRGLLAAK